MFFELIATVTAGFAAGGVIMLLRRLTGGRLARWLVPAGAGIAMLTYAIWSEYSWYSRTTAGLPETMEVALTVESTAPWRPWTYVKPYIDRFIAVDRGSVRTNADLPDQRLVDLYAFGRWAPVKQVRAVFDCKAGRRADLVEGVTFAEDGSLEGAVWIDTGLADPVTEIACSGG